MRPLRRRFSQQRRTFLQVAGTGTAAWLLGCGKDVVARTGEDPDAGSPATDPLPQPEPPVLPPEEISLSDNFPLALASGDVTQDSAVLWTRYGGGLPLQCVVWEMDGERYARVAGKAACAVEEGGFVHVDVQGLTPSARYRYAFYEWQGVQAVARSPIGRFRTAGAVGSLEPLVLGAVSCVKLGHSFAPLMRAAERTDLDAFLLLGDTTYNDGAGSVEQFRERWLASLSQPEWRALLSGRSVFATWDDHEVGNDWTPEKLDSGNVAAARQVWFEDLPVRRDPKAPGRVWRSVRWGRTVELFALDCRGERKPSTGEYLSRAQMNWLKVGLAESPAVFKILLNSVPIGEFPFPFTLASGDRWAGFPEQRAEILGHVEKAKVGGVLWLSGDFHLGSMGRVATSGPGTQAIEVLAGPGAQSANPGLAAVRGDQFDFVTGTNNYVALHLEPATRDCRVVFHDGEGKAFADRTYRL